MTFAELRAAILAQFQEFFSLGWEREEVVAEDSIALRAYDIEKIFYLGTSLPTDTYTLLYDQALLPFERVFFDYLYNKKALLLSWEANPDQEKMPDFFDVAFEKLFDIPVDVGLEQTMIVRKEESGIGVEYFAQGMDGEGDRLLRNLFSIHVLSKERDLSSEFKSEPLVPPSPTSVVTDTNISPTAQDFGIVINQNGIITSRFLASDDGGINALTFHVTPLGAYAGTFTVNNGAGTFTFDPGNFYNYLPEGVTTTLSYSYSATDSSGASSDTKTLDIQIVGVNDPPIPTPDIVSINEDFTTILGTTVPANISLLPPSLRTLNISPLGNDTDIDSASILIWGPTSIPSPFDILGVTTFSILVISIQNQPSLSLSLDSLQEGEIKSYVLTYDITDLNSQVSTTLTLNVIGENDPPQANPDVDSIDENDTPISTDVLSNDTDVDFGDNLTLLNATITSATYGATLLTLTSASASVVGNQIQFSPGTDFDLLPQGQVATVNITYTMEDTLGLQDSSTLTITVNGINDAPVANPDVASMNANVVTLVDVLANDTDVDDSSSFTLVSAVINSVNLGIYSLPFSPSDVDIQANQIQFSPGTDFNLLGDVQAATVNITYTMEDALGAQSSSTLTLTVNGVSNNYIVDNASEVVDGNYSAGQLSLPEALQLAEAGVGPSIITFASGITSISLAAAGGYSINSDITIDGNGTVSITLVDNAQFLVGTTGPGDLTLNDIYLTHAYNTGVLAYTLITIFSGGSATLEGNTHLFLTQGFPSQFNYGVSVVGGNLTLNDSVLIDAVDNSINTLGVGIRATSGSTVTMNDSSSVPNFDAFSSTINMNDSSIIPSILRWGSNSILNIYDPAPSTDGTHPIVARMFTETAATVNIFDAGTTNIFSDYVLNTSGSFVSPTIKITPPIILDLNGDGVHLLSPEGSSVSLTNFTEGQNTAKIGWMSPQDGMLIYDYDNDSNVTHLNEFSFVSYAPEARTDLEALSLAFDTNHDAVFDGLDAHFTQFGVWNDGNSNGIVDLNEYATLEQLGISSIKLISDNQQVFENGNIIFGYSTYTTLDGSIHQLADVGLKIAMESNVQIGTENNDVLINSPGNDILYGSLGNDTLYGGSGSDILQGGAGADRFVMSLLGSGDNHITLEDFDPSKGDTLMIYDVLHVLDGHDDVLSALDSLASFSHPNENSTVVTFNTGDTLQINIPIDSFHDTAIASQIVVEQQPLG